MAIAFTYFSANIYEMCSINQRIEELINELFNGNNSLASKELGVNEASIRQYRKNTLPNANFLTKLVELFGVSADWLLTGRGEMKRIEEVTQLYHPKTPEPIRDNQLIPLYDIDATLGFQEILEHRAENILDYISIPDIPRCDGAIHVVGDSMYPILKSGDIVLYKEVNDLQCIFYGEMYLLALSAGGDEYITVKYVQKSDIDGDHLKLVSQNQNHQPKEIHKSSIRAIALVKASIRFNTLI